MTLSTQAQTLFGFPVSDTCPCGKVVSISEGQRIAFDEITESWHRICGDCLRMPAPQNPN